MARRIIDRNGTITPKEIDKGIKNIWKWEWLEREVCGELVSRHIQKLGEKGKAFCTLCKIYQLHRDGGLLNSTYN